MNPCLFAMAINSATAVYGADKQTEVDMLNVGNQVCVTEIIPGDWLKVHWSRANVGHTGYLHEVTAKTDAVPSAPVPHEEEYNTVPPPPPSPPPPALNMAPPTAPAPGRGKNDSNLQPEPPPAIQVRPAAIMMQCFPADGPDYVVAYTNGHLALISRSGTTREYPVLDVHDYAGNTLYVSAQRHDQRRVLYFAFNYGANGGVMENSQLRVKAPGGYDKRDRCEINWGETK